jgi:hypothetical protein
MHENVSLFTSTKLVNQNGGIIWSTTHHDQLFYQIRKLSRPTTSEELYLQSEAGLTKDWKTICHHMLGIKISRGGYGV